MADLVQWLTACLDEDERIARAATPGPWERVPERVGWLASEEYWSVVDCSGTPAARENAEHVAAHDPARVLREVEMKRSLVAAYASALTVGPDVEGGYKRPIREALARQARDFLLVLALPYADRPGFAEAIASVE